LLALKYSDLRKKVGGGFDIMKDLNMDVDAGFFFDAKLRSSTAV
jgi:hypothetical protein